MASFGRTVNEDGCIWLVGYGWNRTYLNGLIRDGLSIYKMENLGTAIALQRAYEINLSASQFQ
jgi:hypothetical protein